MLILLSAILCSLAGVALSELFYYLERTAK